MRYQAVVAYSRVIDQAALHHVPAEQPLRSAQKKQQPQSAGNRRRHRPRPQEKQKREQEDNAGHPSEKPVGVFHPKDELEAGQGHVGVDQFEFGELPVVFKHLLPLALIERRNCAPERLPVDHRKTGAGQAYRAAEDDQGKYQQTAQGKPRHDHDRRRVPRIRLPGRRRGGYPAQRLKTSELLVPPKPKLLLIAICRSTWSWFSVTIRWPAAPGSRLSMFAEAEINPDSIINSV